MSDTELMHKIALGLIPGVGDISARKLVSYTGSVEAVFSEPYSSLVRIPGIGENLARSITERNYLAEAEREAKWVVANKVETLFYLDERYPARLRECEDSPVTLFYKGNADLDSPKMISIVGTRRATSRGIEICGDIISQLATLFPDLIIVSGLAYGIDIAAHKAALAAKLQTIAVLAHGLKTIYPPVHTNVARQMVSNGGLLTDFVSTAPTERNNFLKRNRIIAGLPVGLLIVESGVKGGAVVTAEMAMSYNRDVMAVPGRPSDNWSGGCNRLIKRNIAALIENAADICDLLNWSHDKTENPLQTRLFDDFSDPENEVFHLLTNRETLTADQISAAMQLPISKLSSILLSLEMKGAIRCLPGNIYRLKA
jgi:DNA processing protein